MEATRQLAALADPTRRTIFEMIVRDPRSVQAIADVVPVSRPAVSQHLKVLTEAGLVVATRDGTRHIYAARRQGLDELHKWLDAMWDDALDRLAATAEKEHTTMTTPIPAVHKRRRLPLPIEDAFHLFTDRIGTWWPVDGFSIAADLTGGPPASVRFEGRVGGRVVEVWTDGTEYAWADVIAWQPPNRFVLAWHPTPEPLAASILEVRFSPDGDGTLLELEHRGWEEFGAEGTTIRANYDPGWDTVLAALDAAVGQSVT